MSTLVMMMKSSVSQVVLTVRGLVFMNVKSALNKEDITIWRYPKSQPLPTLIFWFLNPVSNATSEKDSFLESDNQLAEVNRSILDYQETVENVTAQPRRGASPRNTFDSP